MEYNQPSEIVKDVNFDDNANNKIVAGVEKLAKAVKSTLGASGKCVIYEDARGLPVITKDGVTVAESVAKNRPSPTGVIKGLKKLYDVYRRYKHRLKPPKGGGPGRNL